MSNTRRRRATTRTLVELEVRDLLTRYGYPGDSLPVVAVSATGALAGDSATMTVELSKPVALEEGLGFAVREGGKTVAAGTVTRRLP